MLTLPLLGILYLYRQPGVREKSVAHVTTHVRLGDMSRALGFLFCPRVSQSKTSRCPVNILDKKVVNKYCTNVVSRFHTSFLRYKMVAEGSFPSSTHNWTLLDTFSTTLRDAS